MAEISRKGLLDIDLVIAFVLILFIFVISSNIASSFAQNAGTNSALSVEIASKMSRSYGVLSQLSDSRDNDITLSKLQSLKPDRVSLKAMGGYYYGGKSDSLCIQRAVYIKDLNEVGILEVC